MIEIERKDLKAGESYMICGQDGKPLPIKIKIIDDKGMVFHFRDLPSTPSVVFAWDKLETEVHFYKEG